MVTREQWEILYRYQNADTIEKRHLYAWKALAEETTQLYEALPTDLRVRFKPGQPYAAAADLHRVHATRYLVVSTDNNFHPVWTCEENLRFRAVHDWYGHILTGYDFTLDGELGAYMATGELHTPSAKHALFTEVYVQALYAIVLGHFPEQKVVLV